MKPKGQERGPVRIAAFGAGNRMNKYLRYILAHPEEAQLVAVVEPNPLRRRAMADKSGLPERQMFGSEREFFDSTVEADAAFICSPENVHFAQASGCIGSGLHVLLEKPIAQSFDQCRELAEAARRRGVRVGVCHVLRLHPYFAELHRLANSGRLGRIVSVSHRVAVGIDRATHSFVRGNLSRSSEANPILLSKSCHDIDLISWIVGSPCRRVASFGSLGWFKPENAPAGSATRCIDCAVERECPYSAVNLYRERREWIANFDVREGESSEQAIERELAEGAHGRCVFRCNNDVADRQTVAMEFENGSVATLSVDLFTAEDGRETRITMTNGEIEADGSTIIVKQLRPRSEQRLDFSSLADAPLHGGADLQIVADFIRAVNDPTFELTTDIDHALESHRIGFMAEASRRNG